MGRSGEFVKNLDGDAAYKSFRPAALPPNPGIEIDGETSEILAKAHASIARLDEVARLVPNIELFLSMYVRKEALISSQIEGTQCTLEDILDPQIDSNKNLDVLDVVNYVNACYFAISRLEKLPLCNRLLREVHEKLMEGVRGEEKEPGEFRRSQNWIGPANSSLAEARYIPPNPQDMQMALDELENFINEEDDMDPLICAALIHYQFETIHPFLDGNGRIGRMLILLYLMDKKLLSKPVIYISYFLKKNQVEYYDRMTDVRKNGTYEQWVKFFLEAVAAAAEDSLASIKKLSELHERDFGMLPQSNRKNDNIKKVFEYIERHPIADIKVISADLKISYNTASAAVKKLVETGILREISNASRNRVFVYEDYLEILRKDT